MWITLEELIWMVVPLLATFIVTWLIGFERQNIGKAAGISAHVLVAMASCAIAIMQQMMYKDAIKAGVNVEGQRLIAQVIAGVGFIGAGVIMKGEKSIKGLTTAGTLWSCAALGLIFGSGEKYFILGLILGVFLISFIYLRDISRKMNPFKKHSNKYINKDLSDLK